MRIVKNGGINKKTGILIWVLINKDIQLKFCRCISMYLLNNGAALINQK